MAYIFRNPASAGSVTANQGTPAAVASAWPIEVTDGTNVAAVKAAATAPIAADPALVVAISPNSSLPISGAVTADQGAPTLVASAWPTKITDGVNTADVTAASALKVDGAAVTQPVSAAALPLPAGAATEVTLATRLAEATFTGRINTQGQKVMATSTPIVIASDQSAVPISAAALPLPTGASTSANQTTLGSQTTKINDGTNTAAVKAAATAPIAADSALVVAISPNSSLSITTTNTTATGALGALNAAVTVALAGQQSVGFQLDAGTLIGTIIPELSFDSGVTYNAAFFDDANAALTTSIVFTAANTPQARTILMQGGATHARVRVSFYTSGTANLTLSATQGQDATVVSAPTDGFKRTYSASIIGLVAPAVPTDVFTITGAASILVRITRIVLSATRTATSVSDIALIKRSTANTLGTSTTPTIVPYNSDNPAASAVVRAYTANPVLGTAVGTLFTGKLFIPAVGIATYVPMTELQPGIKFGSSVALRGASEVLAINLNGVTIAGNNFDITIEWTEEPN